MTALPAPMVVMPLFIQPKSDTTNETGHKPLGLASLDCIADNMKTVEEVKVHIWLD